VHAEAVDASGLNLFFSFDCILSVLIGHCMAKAIGVSDWSIVILFHGSFSCWAVVDGRDPDYFGYFKIASVDHGYSAFADAFIHRSIICNN
jgi:hypothetical protein